MEKKNILPVTTWIFVGIILAVIAALLTGIVEAMNALMIQLNWCGKEDAWCLSWHYLLFLGILIILGLIIDSVRAISRNKQEISNKLSGSSQEREMPNIEIEAPFSLLGPNRIYSFTVVNKSRSRFITV